MGEGLTGWVAKERRMVSIGQQAYKDPRFRFFHDLPEDTFEAFLSVPVISRDEVVGVINVQHRAVRRHMGSEMEMLMTVGEQVGCVIVLARIGDKVDSLMSPIEALLAAPPVQRAKTTLTITAATVRARPPRVCNRAKVGVEASGHGFSRAARTAESSGFSR
jgi:signal transduction protein with GAF and PtsI domain